MSEAKESSHEISPLDDISALLEAYDNSDAKAIHMIMTYMSYSIFVDIIENHLFTKTDALSLTCKGYIKYKKHDYKNAKKIFEKGCELNCPYAFNFLGDLYYYGHGVGKNLTKSRTLFEKGCELGCCCSFTNLAFLYEFGYGINQDMIKAHEYYRKACEMECTYGFFLYGTLCRDIGTQSGYDKARSLLEKGCDAHHRDSILALGDMYYNGQGVKKDYTKAGNYYMKASCLDCQSATIKLADMYLDGLGFDKNDDKAFELYKLLYYITHSKCREIYKKYKDKKDIHNMSRIAYLMHIKNMELDLDEQIALNLYVSNMKVKNIQETIKVASSIGKCDLIIANTIALL
jgi:TPR repeat protein